MRNTVVAQFVVGLSMFYSVFCRTHSNESINPNEYSSRSLGMKKLIYTHYCKGMNKIYRNSSK